MKNITEEINRIKKIMNIKNLITESLIDDIVKWIDNVLDEMTRAKVGERNKMYTVGDITIGDETSFKNFRDILETARTTKTLGALNEQQKRTFYNILKETTIKVGEKNIKFSDSIFKIGRAHV